MFGAQFFAQYFFAEGFIGAPASLDPARASVSVGGDLSATLVASHDYRATVAVVADLTATVSG